MRKSNVFLSISDTYPYRNLKWIWKMWEDRLLEINFFKGLPRLWVSCCQWKVLYKTEMKQLYGKLDSLVYMRVDPPSLSISLMAFIKYTTAVFLSMPVVLVELLQLTLKYPWNQLWQLFLSLMVVNPKDFLFGPFNNKYRFQYDSFFYFLPNWTSLIEY